MAKRNLSGRAKKVDSFKKKSGAIHKQNANGKKQGSAFNKGKSSSNPYRPDPSGGKPGS